MMISAASQSADRFGTTRWSVVRQLASTEPPTAQNALCELVQRYWYPAYAYVRRCGHAPPVAQDITRCFLNSLMRQFRDGHARADESHFRCYLLDQLNIFLGGDWREIVEGDNACDLVAPDDLEARNQRDNAGTTSPENAYQHSFALEIVARALERLRAEAQQTGHLDMYRVLETHLARDPGAGEYDALATCLRTRPLALAIALKRLRQRFRELVGQELADTVVSARDLASEQVALRTILHEMRMP